MTWRAHIDPQRGFVLQAIPIYLLDEWEGGYTLLGPAGETMTTVTRPEAGAEEPTPPPTLTLPDQAAPALLAALARHLGAVEHPEQLRRDYEAERKRVDTFIGHLTRSQP